MKNLMFALCFLPLFMSCKEPQTPLSIATVQTVQTDTVKQYTHIKKGMEKQFVDVLLPEKKTELSTEEMKEYKAHKKRVLQAYLSGESIIDIDPVTPEGNYYLNYSGFYKDQIINIEEVKQFLE